jgi:lauroyl/myristoyl acyltransferase
MRRVIRSLKFGFSEAAGFGGFFFWRGLERCLGVDGLYAVARAFYFSRATFNELFRRPPRSRDEPEWLRTDGRLPARIRRRTLKYLNYLLKSFPDRLAEPAWLCRCRMEGVEHVRAAQQAGRPVVLAFFHFGPIYTVRQWVRAHGFPVAAFVSGALETRGGLAQFRDRRSPFPGVPITFYPRQLRAMTEFLAAGNLLLIAVDTAAGRHTTAAADGAWTLDLNTGPARLANRAGADLILISIINEGPWRFRLKFSPPIPGAELGTEVEQAAANQRLLAMMLPDFKAHPDQFDLPRDWQRIPSPAETAPQ